jgi:hypothetical protein
LLPLHEKRLSFLGGKAPGEKKGGCEEKKEEAWAYDIKTAHFHFPGLFEKPEIFARREKRKKIEKGFEKRPWRIKFRQPETLAGISDREASS